MAQHFTYDSQARYSNVSIFLHWTIAALIVARLGLGMTHALHHWLAVAIALLSLARLAWRLAHPLLPLPTVMVGWEKAMARLAHIAFYVAIIGIPLLDDLARHGAPYAMLVLLLMHIGAALKHAYVQRNPARSRTALASESAR